MILPSATCRRCGAALNPGEARGLCPVCLMKTSLEKEAVADPQGAVDTAWLERNQMAPTPAAAETIHRFGDYELYEEIGRGGMGVIYRAKQLSLDRIVAVKTILTGPLASPDFVQRFNTEAHAAAVLDHPNIVPIFEVGNHQGQPYYSMRLVSGRNLDQALKQEGHLPPREAATLIATIARAIHYAHQRGVLHRDLKPANILLDAEGNPHVTDFGLAKLLEEDDGLTLTQAALGTPNYMAPEQASGGSSELTTEADVYSLGAVLFEALTGKKLFTARTPLATITQAREQEPPKPSAVARNIPRDLDTICWKCLEKEPQRRYSSAQALAEDLERWLKGEPIRARRVGMVERMGLWCRRKPAMASMAGAALAAVLIVSGIATWRLIVAREQKQIEQYAANISLADSYIRDGATDRAMELLLQCPEHLRHWEWGRLVYLCNQEIASISTQTNVARSLDMPQIQGLAVNHSGNRVVTKDRDGVLKLWNPTNPEPLVVRGDSTNEVTAWDFAPDGSQLVLGMVDGAVEMLDAATGQRRWLLRPEMSNNAGAVLPPRRIIGIEIDPRKEDPIWAGVTARPESVLSLGYSADGQRIAAAKGNREILMLDALTGAQQAEWEHHLTDFERLWFTPDGSLLVAKGGLGIELIDPASGQPKGTNVWSEQETDKLFVDPTGHTAFTFEHSGMAYLWKDGKRSFLLQHYPPRMKNSRSAFFDRTGRWVCTSGKSTKAALFEIATGRLVFSLNQDVNGGAFSEDGLRLVTFGPDRLFRLWDVDQGRELRVLRGHLNVPEASAFSGDGGFIVTASREGVVKLWTGSPGRELVQTDGLSMFGLYSPDGQKWATAPDWNGTFLCEADSGHVAAEFPLKKAIVLTMAFSPDSRFLLTVGSEKVARIWDVPGQRLAGLLRGHERVIWSVAWSTDGRWIATGDSGGVARIWDGATWREVRSFQAQSRSLYCVQFDPSGRRLLTAGFGPPKLWDIQTGQLLSELDDEQQGSSWATFSPDGRRIICPCRDRKIRLWDAASGRLVERWPTRSEGWPICAFTPDSKRFVVPVVDYGLLGLAAPFIEIWDTEHGRHLLDLRGHTDSIFSSVFNRWGNRILTASMDETVRQWETFPWRGADYRQFAGATPAQRIRNYADRYWRDRLAAEQAGGPTHPRPLGSEKHLTPREWEQVLRPVRAPNTPSNLLNLDDFYTGALDGIFRPDVGGYEGDDDLSRLPKGRVTFDGVEFDVRGVILLRLGENTRGFSHGWLHHPPQVDNIPIAKRIRRLHVLHAAVGQAATSRPIGSYILHYTDGSQVELEILYGRDLRDWWLGGPGDLEREVSDAKVAWTGSNPLAEQCQAQVRLFHRAYDNPRPDLEVVSVDFVSKEAAAAPFLVAMTVEP